MNGFQVLECNSEDFFVPTKQKYNIIIPGCQRIVDIVKVDNIFQYQLQRKKQTGYFEFIGLVVFCELQNQNVPEHETNPRVLYLIDGQHRFHCMKKLATEYMHEFSFLAQVIPIQNVCEIKHYYDIINKNTPLPELTFEIIDKDKQIMQETCSYFQTKYPQVWSTSIVPKRPSINFNAFQEALQFIYINLKSHINNYNAFIEILENYNLSLSKWNPENFTKVSDKMMERAIKMEFFFGLFPCEYEQVYKFAWARNIVEHNTGIRVKRVTRSSNKRSSIPKAIREQVWDKYIGESQSSALCIICNHRKINMRKFHCGHIVSDKDGGTATVDNLLPICEPCNLSMGSNHMDMYVKEYYPQNYQQYKNINYKDIEGNYISNKKKKEEEESPKGIFSKYFSLTIV